MFLHAHPGGAPVASSPRLDDIHIAMRFVMEAYHCEALVVPPSGEGNPAYDAAFGDVPEPEPPKPEPTWDEALDNFEETLATWLGLADEDPTKPRSAEARYLVPEVLPDPSATAGEDATSSSASSTAPSSPTAETASGGGAVRGDAPAGARAAKEELARFASGWRSSRRRRRVTRRSRRSRRRGGRRSRARRRSRSRRRPPRRACPPRRRARAERARGSSCRDRCARGDADVARRRRGASEHRERRARARRSSRASRGSIVGAARSRSISLASLSIIEVSRSAHARVFAFAFFLPSPAPITRDAPHATAPTMTTPPHAYP